MNSVRRNTVWLAGICMAVLLLSSCTKKQDQTPSGDAGSAREKHPKIEAVEENIDFGEVKQGAVVEKIFTIRNTGGAPLNITKARGS